MEKDKQLFSLALSPTFKFPVEFEFSNENGRVVGSFTGIFKRADEDEWKAMMERNHSDADLVRDRLVGWENVDKEFSPEALTAVLKIDGMDAVIAKAFVAGNGVSVRKN